MFDETSRSHMDDDSTRHIHRGHRRMQIPARPTRNEVLFC